MLNLNELIGFGVFEQLPLLYVGTETNSTSTLTTYTFNGVDIGPESAERVVIIPVAGVNGGGTVGAVSSATINGIAATVNASKTLNGNTSAVLSAVVPSGTSVTVTVTFSASRNGCGIWAHSVYGLRSATATSTLTQSSGTDFSLTPDFDGVAFVAGIRASSLSIGGDFTGRTALNCGSTYLGQGAYLPTHGDGTTKTASNSVAVAIWSGACWR